MTPLEFQNQKNQILQGIDLSRKGSVDEPIKKVVDFINAKKEFVTTSSCSGRVILFCENNSEESKKGCKWLYTSHEYVDEEEFLLKVDPSEGNVTLKFEPMILHVQCLSLENAKSMHTCAIEAGFRNSGITLGKRGKTILAVRSCLGLEVPLADNGTLLVSEMYLKFLIRKSNEKMKENHIRIERFFNNLMSRIEVKTKIAKDEHRQFTEDIVK